MSNVSQMSKDIYPAVQYNECSTESGVREQTRVSAFHKEENVETRKLKRIWQSSKEVSLV